jgi:hypothetical protein
MGEGEVVTGDARRVGGEPVTFFTFRSFGSRHAIDDSPERWLKGPKC